MREILFRGIAENTNNKWVYGSLVVKKPTIANKDNTVEAFIVIDEQSIPIKLETIGEFTGIIDSMGVKIFEGDIVKDEAGNLGSVHYRADSTMANWIVKHSPQDSVGSVMFENRLVIGDIHTKVELLNRRIELSRTEDPARIVSIMQDLKERDVKQTSRECEEGFWPKSNYFKK